MPNYITPNSDGLPVPENTPINEAWSDAARAAAAAGRGARKQGKSITARRLAVRKAFKKSGGKTKYDRLANQIWHGVRSGADSKQKYFRKNFSFGDRGNQYKISGKGASRKVTGIDWNDTTDVTSVSKNKKQLSRNIRRNEGRLIKRYRIRRSKDLD